MVFIESELAPITVLFKNKNNTSFLDDFGFLLNQQWNIKKKLSRKVTNNSINETYEWGMKNGAIGGKLLGAGKGGFMFFMGLFLYIVFNELTKAPLIAKGDPFYGESERFHY